MNNFDYYAPTKVVFGKDTEKERAHFSPLETVESLI